MSSINGSSCPQSSSPVKIEKTDATLADVWELDVVLDESQAIAWAPPACTDHHDDLKVLPAACHGQDCQEEARIQRLTKAALQRHTEELAWHFWTKESVQYVTPATSSTGVEWKEEDHYLQGNSENECSYPDTPGTATRDLEMNKAADLSDEEEAHPRTSSRIVIDEAFPTVPCAAQRYAEQGQGSSSLDIKQRDEFERLIVVDQVDDDGGDDCVDFCGVGRRK
mmetsp:Transcript_106724/g.168560  ORF Transcript_106724/g.168560 Transcript_106724/m.168560 type:complete len:224 (+) Transcript_106724:25-696(+)